MIQIKCKKCNKEFKTYPSRVKNGRGIFCSKLCHNLCQVGKLPWNTGIKSKKLSDSKKGNKNPMWKGGMSKKEQDSRYAKTLKGKQSHRESNAKYNDKITSKIKRKEWQKDRLKNNTHYKLKRNISNGIWCKLSRHRGFKKDQNVINCLPYTIEELKNHLEKKFTKGMSWSNYGEWHIDHKIPDSSFNYSSTKDEEFQKSWALSNLQPLWWRDNLIKGRKIIEY